MRNTKTLFLKLFFVFLFSNPGLSLGQSGKYLPGVDLIPQEQIQWCWAACMEMIMEFHDNTTTIQQCDLVNKYVQYNNNAAGSNPFASLPTAACPSGCPADGSFNPSAWESINYSKRNGVIKQAFFDLLFSFHGYNSIEDIETLEVDWGEIRAEIDGCRPFVLLLTKREVISNPNTNYNHAVVVKGYYDTGTQYVLVNDPQFNRDTSCRACEYLLPISIFTDPIDQLNSVTSVIRMINPKDGSYCDTCTQLDSTSNHPLIQILENSVTSEGPFFDLGKSTYSEGEIDSLLAIRDENGDRYFFQNRYFTPSGGNFKERIGMTLRREEQPISVHFEKIDGNWAVKGVTLQECTPFTEFITISRRGGVPGGIKDTISFNNFEIVELHPDFYQFYRIQRDNEIIYTPIRAYPGLPFEPEEPYSQKELVDYFNDDKLTRSLDYPEELIKERKCFLFDLFKKKRDKK